MHFPQPQWHQAGNKPLHEPMMTNEDIHTLWVNLLPGHLQPQEYCNRLFWKGSTSINKISFFTALPKVASPRLLPSIYQATDMSHLTMAPGFLGPMTN